MSNATLLPDQIVPTEFVTLLRSTAKDLYKRKRGVYVGVSAYVAEPHREHATVYFGYEQLDAFGNSVGNPRYGIEARAKITTHSDRPDAGRYVATQSQGFTGEIVGVLTALANVLRAGDDLVVSFTFGSKRNVTDTLADGEIVHVEDTADLSVYRKGRGVATFRVETVLRRVQAHGYNGFAVTL